MENWNKLSMYDRANYIRMGVASGLTKLSDIHKAYNTFAEGGYNNTQGSYSNSQIAEGVYGSRTNPAFYKGQQSGKPVGVVVVYNPKTGQYDTSKYMEYVNPAEIQSSTKNMETPQTSSNGWLKNLINNLIEENPITSSRRVRNYQKAMDSASLQGRDFSQQNDMFNNISEFFNIAGAGIPNRLSSSQNIGLFIDALQGDNIIDSWFGNSGIVSDKFAKEHPYWSMAINGGTDAAGAGLTSFALNNYNKARTMMSDWRYNRGIKRNYPDYTTYYHGSPVEFNINDAYMGTEEDMGLHVAKSPSIPREMAGKDGIVYKLLAPKESATTLDINANDARLLSTDYKFESGKYFVSPKDSKIIRQELKRQAIPYRNRPRFLSDGTVSFDQDLHINLRDRLKEGIPESKRAAFDKEADEIMQRYNKDLLQNNTAEINSDAAALLDKYGLTTVKYPNAYEGFNQNSYFITNPKKIVPLRYDNSNWVLPTVNPIFPAMGIQQTVNNYNNMKSQEDSQLGLEK